MDRKLTGIVLHWFNLVANKLGIVVCILVINTFVQIELKEGIWERRRDMSFTPFGHCYFCIVCFLIAVLIFGSK